MNPRTRCLITAAFGCHLLLAPAIVTSQLLPVPNQPPTPQSLPDTRSARSQEDVTLSALEQEKDGVIYKLRGKAEIHYGTYILYADEITYNSDTGDSTEDGHVVLDGGPNDEHIRASNGAYNLRSEAGRFEIVAGTIGMRPRGTRMILTTANPFAFTGKVVVKTGPDHYLVYDGTITTCEMPKPKWDFNAHRADVEVGGNAKIYRSSFDLYGLSILYFPFATMPAQRLPRQSGFLIPAFGTSSIRGTIVGESFFWAISRSMDAHLGAELYSKRGWAPQGEFRARLSDTSFIDLNSYTVLDRLPGTQNQGGTDVHLLADGTFHDFRAVANVDYLSSYVFRLAFSDIFTQAANSEVKSQAFLSKSTDGFFNSASMERYQNFESITPGDDILILHTPSFEYSSVDRPLWHSPFYWSYDAAFEGLSRSEPGFATAPLLGRFDLNPSLSLPFQLHGWSFLPELSLRDTLYTQELIPGSHASVMSSTVGTAASDAISRKALEGSVELRPPALHRVFEREFLGRKWKHVIEPRVVYNYVTGVNNFDNILRFDERDILSDTNEVEYAVVNRLYAKRVSDQPEDCGQPGMPTLFVGGAPPVHRIPWERQAPPGQASCNAGPQVKEIVTWELAQKYYIDPTFGGALQPGTRNVFSNTVDLTGVAFLTEPAHLSPLISRLRIQTTARTDVEWDVDYDFKLGEMTASTVLVNYHFGGFTFGGGDALLRTPGETALSNSLPPTNSFNQFRLVAGYGHPNKRGLSVATNIGFDADLNSLQYAAVQGTYNWDCCGLTVEFRRSDLNVVQTEDQYRFTFALANIGAFGNLRWAQKLF
jgi:LPS-assembly protein